MSAAHPALNQAMRLTIVSTYNAMMTKRIGCCKIARTPRLGRVRRGGYGFGMPTVSGETFAFPVS